MLAWSVLNPLETEDYRIRIHNCVSSPCSEDHTLVILILYNFGRRELAFLFCAWAPGHEYDSSLFLRRLGSGKCPVRAGYWVFKKKQM